MTLSKCPFCKGKAFNKFPAKQVKIIEGPDKLEFYGCYTCYNSFAIEKASKKGGNCCNAAAFGLVEGIERTPPPKLPGPPKNKANQEVSVNDADTYEYLCSGGAFYPFLLI